MFKRNSASAQRTVSVLVIHGINTKAPGYSDRLRKGIRRRLGKSLAEKLDWREVFWAGATRGNQRAYSEAASASHHLKFKSIRNWVTTGLGDAAAYQVAQSKYQNAYQNIQSSVQAKLCELSPVDGEERPLLIIAHSLGGHIASTFIHDKLKGAGPGPFPDAKTAFESLQTLSGIVTFGSNIPLFTFAFKAPDVRPVVLPSYAMDVANVEAEWRNFYSPTDVLGFPLRPLNDAYWETVWKDVAIQTGPLLGRTPLSHNHYWTNGRVQREITEMIRNLMVSVR